MENKIRIDAITIFEGRRELVRCVRDGNCLSGPILETGTANRCVAEFSDGRVLAGTVAQSPHSANLTLSEVALLAGDSVDINEMEIRNSLGERIDCEPLRSPTDCGIYG